MKKLTILFTILLISISVFSQVKIIFDTDIGGDADDLGALAMLHNFIDKDECNLLAIMSWTTEEYAVPAVDAINRFYGHPDIPIGVRKDEIYFDSVNYNKSVADNFPHKLSYADVPDATMLYRQLLAQSDDKEITIITVGPLANIQNLIKSGPDKFSDLNGKELIEKKVREFVIMGGQFPKCENEWNFNGNMPGVTKFVIKNLTVPLIFTGFEIGSAIKTGEVFNSINTNTPLYVGFKHFSKHAPWIKEYYKGKILDNSTFDQTAVLYAIRNGEGIWWDKISGGYCSPDDNGGNIWISGEATNHAYLELTIDPEKMASLIESIMLGEF